MRKNYPLEQLAKYPAACGGDDLLTHQQSFHQENQEILKAGLSSSPWQHIDTTATRLNGVTKNCHVLCNPLYTFYCTLPHRDRLSTIDALRGGASRAFRFNNDTLTLVQMMNVYANWQTKLKRLPFNQDLSEAEINEFIRVELVGLAGCRREGQKSQSVLD